MRKRGQAAMEFLMTYGWAILAAIIVIGVLAVYFRPGSLTQNTAIVGPPFYAQGVTLATGQIQIEIQNNGGEDVTTTGGQALSFATPSSGSCVNATGNGSLPAGTTQVLTFDTCNLASGNSVSADVIISYTRTGTTLRQVSTGTLSGTIP